MGSSLITASLLQLGVPNEHLTWLIFRAGTGKRSPGREQCAMLVVFAQTLLAAVACLDDAGLAADHAETFMRLGHNDTTLTWEHLRIT